MNVVARQTLIEFWRVHPEAESVLSAWYNDARKADWKTPQDIKDQYNSADFLSDNRVIFNVGGNKYRLVVRVSYTFKQAMIKFVGTHAQYDKIDAATI